MHSDDATVVECDPKKRIVVSRKGDGHLTAFVYFSDMWLSENHKRPNDILYGTQFVLNE